MRRLFVLLMFATGLLPVALSVRAQTAAPGAFKDVGIDEQLGASLPMDATFQDERGETVPLSAFFESGRPVILNFVYHDCPMLCSVLLESFTQTMKEMEFTAGTDFDILTVSFSAIETPDLAARQKERYLGQLGRPAAADGWHFLTGSEEQIDQLTDATGFDFKWIASRSEFAHAAALIFVSPDGTITRYLHGLYFEPSNVRKALVEASDGKVGSPVDQILLYCFQYDPTANSYVLHATNLMKLGALLTILCIGFGIWMLRRRERSKVAARLSHVNS
jgi:protein SCO1/2